MSPRSWTLPPLDDACSDPAAVCVDEHLLRRVLEINPAFARGRSPRELKRALERRPGAVAAAAVEEAAWEASPSHVVRG